MLGARCGRDRMVVSFITTYEISAYHHWRCEFGSRSCEVYSRSIQHYVIKLVSVCGRSMFSPGTPVSSTNKTDRHDITEILLKVAFNIITLTLPRFLCRVKYLEIFYILYECIPFLFPKWRNLHLYIKIGDFFKISI